MFFATLVQSCIARPPQVKLFKVNKYYFMFPFSVFLLLRLSPNSCVCVCVFKNMLLYDIQG